MNGDAVSATTEIIRIAELTPGSARAARAPTRIRDHSEESSVGGGRVANRKARSATSMAANESVLTAKAAE